MILNSLINIERKVAQLILSSTGEISTYWASSLEWKASRSYFIVGIAATAKGSNPL
jgi:hypothetical protein